MFPFFIVADATSPDVLHDILGLVCYIHFCLDCFLSTFVLLCILSSSSLSLSWDSEVLLILQFSRHLRSLYSFRCPLLVLWTLYALYDSASLFSFICTL